jgi:hypothetical protein
VRRLRCRNKEDKVNECDIHCESSLDTKKPRIVLHPHSVLNISRVVRNTIKKHNNPQSPSFSQQMKNLSVESTDYKTSGIFSMKEMQFQRVQSQQRRDLRKTIKCLILRQN